MKKNRVVITILLLFMMLVACKTKEIDANINQKEPDFKEIEEKNEGKTINVQPSEGDKRIADYNMPIDVEISSVGGMVLLEDGSLYTFGASKDMTLGRVDKKYQMSKILENIVDVVQGEYMAFAIDKNGDLWGWCAERNSSWEDYLLEPLPKVIANEVKSVSVGEYQDVIAIIKEDDSLWVWGYAKAACNAKQGFVQILDNVKQVTVSDGDCGVAIRNDNSMWLWGDMPALDIKTETPILYAENVKSAACNGCMAFIDQEDVMTVFSIESGRDIVGVNTISNVKKVNFGSGNGLYLSSDGNLYSWGDANEYGQFGIGLNSWDEDGEDKINIMDAKPILGGITDFDMTAYTAIALDEEGGVYVWGQNMNHILGLDDEEHAIAIPTILYSPIERQ